MMHLGHGIRVELQRKGTESEKFPTKSGRRLMLDAGQESLS